MPHYQNRWIPSRALEILASESGTILDLGGGASPYFKATHVADILPFEVAWRRPFWGGERENKILPRDYTQADICAGKPLPFDKDHFDLGLCSHTLEDLRDPINALAELGRVCKRILVITPSRLLEQTRNIAHPRYCGFSHHPWAVFMGEGFIGFRRKTPNLELPGCHLICPYGKTLSIDDGTFMYHGEVIEGQEIMHFDSNQDVADYREYADRHRNTQFVNANGDTGTLRNRVYYLRQKYFGRT
jgi:SAM-dependent methyltransferase